MAKQKPKTPYQHLLERAREWAHSVNYGHRTTMWKYPKGKLGDGWSLTDLYERTRAADQLGYDVTLVAGDEGLCVVYRKRPKTVPYEFAP